MPRKDADTIDLGELPGHYIRRLQQIAVAIFLQEAAETGITPIQYAALQTIHHMRGIDQRSLAASIGLDTSTLGGVLDRLEARGFIERRPSEADRRLRLLHTTSGGQAALAAVIPAMKRAQKKILAPLPAAEQREFMRMLKMLVLHNNEFSRAPAEG